LGLIVHNCLLERKTEDFNRHSPLLTVAVAFCFAWPNNKYSSKVITPELHGFAVDNGRGHIVSKSVVRYPRVLHVSVKHQTISLYLRSDSSAASQSECLITVFVIRNKNPLKESLPFPILLGRGTDAHLFLLQPILGMSRNAP